MPPLNPTSIFLLGFYDDVLQNLPDRGIVIGERMVLLAVENGENIVRSRGRIPSALLGGSVFCQFSSNWRFSVTRSVMWGSASGSC